MRHRLWLCMAVFGLLLFSAAEDVFAQGPDTIRMMQYNLMYYEHLRHFRLQHLEQQSGLERRKHQDHFPLCETDRDVCLRDWVAKPVCRPVA